MSGIEKKQSALDAGVAKAISGLNELQNDFLNAALDGYSQQIKATLMTKAGNASQQSLAIKQGFVAEAHHVGSYNIEAAAKGQNNHRAALCDAGDPIKDIRITSPEGTTDFQLKFYESGEKSAKAFNHGRYDEVGKIVPADQIDAAKAAATTEAKRNVETRPEVAKRYQNTADRVDTTVSTEDRPDIRSAPLKRNGKGGSEDLVKQTEERGQGPEYEHKDRVRVEFNAMQYRNAAKSGAIAGASISAASELIGLLRADGPLTQEQCMAAAERIVCASLKGAGNAVFVTGIQHVGQSLVDSATGTLLKNTGKQLVKGNVASAAAAITIGLGTNLYKFSCGEVDSIEFAGATISSTVSVVGGAMAYSGGTAAATYLGQWVAAEIAGTAVLGTTLGALGPIALGTVFSIAFSIAMSAYVSHFASQGGKVAINDIQSAMKQLGHGEIDVVQYCGRVGTMAEFKFEWKDLLPFSGGITVYGEYTARKAQLMALQRDLDSQFAALPQQEREAVVQLRTAYLQQLRRVEAQHEQLTGELITRTRERYALLDDQLTRHLEMQFLFFTPVMHRAHNERSRIDKASQRQTHDNARLEAYRAQLASLREQLSASAAASAVDDGMRRKMLAAVDVRLQRVLPERTPWDQANDFFKAA